MKPDRRAIILFLAGIVIMSGICIAQIYSELVHGTVYYILLAFYGLWLLRHYKYLFAVGMIATVSMTIGYFLGFEHSTGAFINRIFSVFTVWVGVWFTIRFRKLYQQEQKHKKQLAALFTNVSEAILLIDKHGKIILGNPGAEKILGYTQNELTSLPVDALIPPRLRTHHDLHWKSFFRNPASRQIGTGKNVFALTKNNQEVPVEISLSSYYDNGELFVIAFVTDITKRKEQEEKIAAQYEQLQQYNSQLEEQVKFRTSELVITNQDLVREIEERKLVEGQLRKSQMLYKAVANNFPDGIIGVLDRNLRYVFIEGKELVEQTDSKPSDIYKVPEFLVQQAEEKIRLTFLGRNLNFEISIGNSFYEVVATPLTEFDNCITEIIVVIRNITKHKKFEDDLLRSLEKEKQLNVLKTRFVTSVSHEFRTPLSTILSSVFLLENYSGEAEATHRTTHLNRIKRSVNSLTELLDDFLSLGKLEEGKIKVIYSELYIREFLDELISEMELIKRKDQKVILNFIGEDELIIIDKSLLTNIMSNLISNAIKYSPPDGTVEIRSELRNGMLALSIIDNGMGIPEAEQKHLFKRFFRAHNAINIQGTGLGLNLVRKYVRLMKGHISFKSIQNQGSTFSVTIPVAIPNNLFTPNSKVYA